MMRVVKLSYLVLAKLIQRLDLLPSNEIDDGNVSGLHLIPLDVSIFIIMSHEWIPAKI